MRFTRTLTMRYLWILIKLLFMQRDYWNIARRDFRALGFVVVLILIFLVFAIGSLGSNPTAQTSIVISAVIILIIGAAYFFISHLFKKRSPRAIPLAYTILAVAIVSNVISNIMAGTLISIGMIVGTLIQIYLLNVVYKASKQKTV